ncbi:MAG: sulfite exporter TauE/SafE family protein [Archangium sp.]|nr:sulfite exporter TauE/SafE family protein [Archangium sp.]
MQLLALIVFCAFLVEAAAGFGSMVIALTVGALFFTVDELLLTLVPVNLVLSIWLAASGASGIKWKFLLKQVAPLMGLGLLIGTLLASKASDAWWLKPIFGLFTIAAASLSLAERVGVRERPLPSAARSLVLLGAGTIHGIFATGGPLAVFVTAKELPDKHEFRATLSMLWVAMNAALLTTWAIAGKLTTEPLTKSAWMLLPLAAGIAVGELIHRRLDEKKFRLVVAVLLLIAGAVLTIQSLLRGNA